RVGPSLRKFFERTVDVADRRFRPYDHLPIHRQHVLKDPVRRRMRRSEVEGRVSVFIPQLAVFTHYVSSHSHLGCAQVLMWQTSKHLIFLILPRLILQRVFLPHGEDGHIFHIENSPEIRVAGEDYPEEVVSLALHPDRKSTRLNSSHVKISYAVFCLKKKQNSCSRDT